MVSFKSFDSQDIFFIGNNMIAKIIYLFIYLFYIFSLYFEKYSADDYFLSRLPIVNMRLAQAGVRLADILNRVFEKKLAMSI